MCSGVIFPIISRLALPLLRKSFDRFVIISTINPITIRLVYDGLKMKQMGLRSLYDGRYCCTNVRYF